MKPTSSDVHDRHLSLTLEELAGRVNAPDRVDAILRRLAAAPATGRGSPGRARWLAAAAMLLGVGITVAVALSRPHAPARESAFAAAPGELSPGGTAPIAVMQEPAPKPKPPTNQTPDHPKGTTPADLAAVRSAEKMLEQEQKLMARLREGKLPGVELLRFETLAEWKYSKGLEGMPAPVKGLDGQKVAMLGFMLPIDEVKDIRHFLLVQSLWSCCYGTPPDVNGIVRVELPRDRPTDYSFEPLLITGTLRVGATVEDGYVVDIYQLHADSIVVLQ